MTIIEAIDTENLAEITKSLAEMRDVNSRVKDHLTALMYACKKKSLGAIQLILQHPDIEIDLDDLTVNHEIALIMAAPIDGDSKEADPKSIDIAKYFLNLPNEKLIKDGKKTLNYLLDYFAWLGDTVSVDRCLKLGADPNSKYLQTAPLAYAIESKHATIVDLLLAHPDINVNLLNYRSDTPLTCAISFGSTDIAKKLLATPQCDLTARSFLYGTPLMAAVYFDNQEVAREITSKHWERCDLTLENASFLLTIQKGARWEWLFDYLLEKGIDVNDDLTEVQKWQASAPSWIYQEAEAKKTPFGEAGFYPTIGDGSFILDRPIWLALHCDNRNAIKWLLGLGANLALSSQSFLKIDNWYRKLPFEDARKEFITTIDESAGFYAFIDILWERLLEFGTDRSGAVYALMNESMERFEAIIHLLEDNKDGKHLLSQYATILYAAYHELWKTDLKLWEEHAHVLFISKGLNTLYGDAINSALYSKLFNTARDKLIAIINHHVKKYCHDYKVERASFSEDDIRFVSSEDKHDLDISEKSDSYPEAFSKFFEALLFKVNAKNEAISTGATSAELTVSSTTKPFVFYRSEQGSVKFTSMHALINELKVDHPLFVKLCNYSGSTHIPHSRRDAGKFLDAIKNILIHDNFSVEWSRLSNGPNSYYLYRLWRKEGKLEQIKKLCLAYISETSKASDEASHSTLNSVIASHE